MKTDVIIDGSNFYHYLKNIKLEKKIFDFIGFCKDLAKTKNVTCTYYIGAVRQENKNKKSRKLYAKQQSFLSALKKQGVDVELGYIIKTGGAYHEKGVDVKMAVDILVGAYENTYDTAFIVSSDTDLLPAIEKALAKGKLIEYVGFSHQPSYALLKHCSSARLLHKKDLERFVS